MDLFSLVPQLMMGVGLAACAGLRAWLPMLVVGVLTRTGFLHVSRSFEFFARTDILIILAVATIIELIGDKFIAVDHFLDAIGTVIRPLAGAVLTSSILTDIDPTTALIIGLLAGGGTAFTIHAGKSLLRAKSTLLAPIHAGIGNAVISFIEDAVTIVGMILSTLLPVLAFAISVIAIIISAWLICAVMKQGKSLFVSLSNPRRHA